MPRKPWTRPHIDTRAASDLDLALGLLDWLELALVDLRLRWAVIRDDLPNTTGVGQRDWKDVLNWIHQALESKMQRKTVDCTPLLDWVQTRWPSLETALMNKLLRLHLEAFAKAKEPYAITRSMRRLQDVLQAVLRPQEEYDPRAFAPLVRAALAHSDPHVRKETDGLVAWTGAFDHIHRMVEEAKNQDADKAREAARWLWKHIADRKNPIAGVEAGIRSLLNSTHVEVAFYASCALRLRYGTDCQDLILPKELPDIEIKINLVIGSNRYKFTSRTPMHLDKAQCYKKQKSKPSKIACGVCMGQTALIYTESTGGLSHSWSLDEYHCKDCGAYTMYLKDD